MSRVEDYQAAVGALTHDQLPRPVAALLEAVARAWVEAEHGIPSETEANRWSKVCTAAEHVVGIE
jgi:hypothetical protein